MAGNSLKSAFLAEIRIPRKGKDPKAGYGRIDLLEKEDKGTHVEVKVGEIKPLSWKWLGVAADEVEHYIGAINSYGYMCARDDADLNLPANRDSRDFCHRLGLQHNKKEVEVADDPYVSSIPNVVMFDSRLSTRAFQIKYCSNGAVHYRCVTLDDNREEEEQSPLDYITGCLLEGIAGEFIPNPSMCGMILDSGLSMIPYLDQVADIRDFVAHLYWILYRGEYDNPGRWISVTFSVIGWIPEIGSAVKATSKIGGRVLTEGLEMFEDIFGNEIRRIFNGQNLDEVIAFINKNKDEWRDKGVILFNGFIKKMYGHLDALKGGAEALARAFGVTAGTIIRQLDEAIEKLKKVETDSDKLLDFDRTYDLLIHELEIMKKELDEITIPANPGGAAPRQSIPEYDIQRSEERIQRKLIADKTYPTYLEDELSRGNLTKKDDTASKLSGAERVAQIKTHIEALAPQFEVRGDGEVRATDKTKKDSAAHFAGQKPVIGNCCMYIMTRTGSGDWRILISDAVGPHTSPDDKVVVIPSNDAPIDYGNWTKGPDEKRNFYEPKLILGHELCGHAALMELDVDPEGRRLDSNVHDPTVNIENLIADEQGITKSERRGLADEGAHRGESFARVIVSRFPINQTSVFSLPASEFEQLKLVRSLIASSDMFVDLRGHTDASGTDAINDKISRLRAQRVRDFILQKVSPQRHLVRGDDTTPLVDRFTTLEGVRDQFAPETGLEDPAEWRRVEIFVATRPAGTANPPIETPAEVKQIEIPDKVKEHLKSGDACEKKIVKGAYGSMLTPKPPQILLPPPFIDLPGFGIPGRTQNPGLQRKLEVGQENDKYEKEADAIAANVVRMPEPGADIHRRCSECATEHVAPQMIQRQVRACTPQDTGVEDPQAAIAQATLVAQGWAEMTALQARAYLTAPNAPAGHRFWVWANLAFNCPTPSEFRQIARGVIDIGQQISRVRLVCTDSSPDQDTYSPIDGQPGAFELHRRWFGEPAQLAFAVTQLAGVLTNRTTLRSVNGEEIPWRLGDFSIRTEERLTSAFFFAGLIWKVGSGEMPPADAPVPPCATGQPQSPPDRTCHSEGRQTGRQIVVPESGAPHYLEDGPLDGEVVDLWRFNETDQPYICLFNGTPVPIREPGSNGTTLPTWDESMDIIDHINDERIQRKCEACVIEDIRPRPEAKSIQRKPMQMPRLKELLTRDFWGFDWAVTDKNVKDALKILDALADPDFGDTIAELHKDNLVNRIFNEIGDEEKGDFANLLQRIQNAIPRTDKKTGKVTVDSCSIEKRGKLNASVQGTKDQAFAMYKAVHGYAFDLEIGDTPDPNVAALMDRHFFHPTHHPVLDNSSKVKFANEIADIIHKTYVQANPYDNICAQQFDTLCAALAAAYVSSDVKTVTYCRSFFKHDKGDRTNMMLHEFVHVFGDVDDTAYGHERLSPHLAPIDAINNADSYSEFVIGLLNPAGLKYSKPPADDYDDCAPDKQKILESRIAYAARMVTNALNVLGNVDSWHHGAGRTTDTHFKSTKRSDISDVIDKFKELKKNMAITLQFECEDACGKKDIGYHWWGAETVHLCPDFFTLPTEDDQIDWILLLVADAEISGKKSAEPGTAGYSNQTHKEAKKNLWSYIGFARAVSNRSWKHLDTSKRLERDTRRTFDDLSEHLLSDISYDKGFLLSVKRFVRQIRGHLTDSIKNAPLEHTSDASDLQAETLKALRTFVKAAHAGSTAFVHFSVEAMIYQFKYEGKPEEEAMNRLIRSMESHLRGDIMKILGTQVDLIKNNDQPDLPAATAAINARRDAFVKSLKHSDSYLKHLTNINTIDEDLDTYANKRARTLPKDKGEDLLDVRMFQGLSVRIDTNKEYKLAVEEMLKGNAFDKKMPFRSKKEIMKPYKQEVDKRYGELKKGK